MKKAFTLVELAIVLVIIGLLVGGVLAGQELIKQAKVNKVIRELTSLQLSIKTFQLKYGQLPGDFNRAIAMLGAAQQGNNDKEIYYNTENYYAFDHMARAGVIVGSYSGTQGAGTLASPYSDPGVNVMESSAEEGVGYELSHLTLSSGVYNKTGNSITIGRSRLNYLYDGAFTPYVASAIDTKFDDGIPSSGSVYWFTGDEHNHAYDGDVTNDCVDTTTITTPSNFYQSNTTVASCLGWVIFRN